MRSATKRGETFATALGVVAVAAWTTWWAWRAWAVSGLSWHFSADGSRWLLSSTGLDVYAHHPELQTGPLSLIAAAALRPLSPGGGEKVALVAMTVIGLLLFAALAPLVPAERRGRRLLLAAVFFAPAWTVLSVRWGHLDDVLAMAGAIGAVRALRAGRPLLTGLALAAAIASKPWAVGFLPLLVALPRGRLRAGAAAALGTAAAWLPFLVANPRTLGALHPPVGLTTSSGLRALGARGSVVPAWGRTTQLLLVPAVALLAAVTNRWPGVLLVAVAVRVALDPQDNAYYVGSAALAAVVFDLLGTRWTVPWTTVTTVLALWQPFVRDYAHRMSTTSGLTHWWFAHPTTVGELHLAWAVLMVAVVLIVAAPRTAEVAAEAPAGVEPSGPA